MNNDDKKAFAELMTITGDIYNKKINTGLMKSYFAMLSHLSIQDVESGFQKHMIDEKQGSFFPKPADIVRNSPVSNVSAKDKAELGWAAIVGEIGRIGPYKQLELEDKQVIAAVKGLGGWTNLCSMTYEQLDWKKKEFMDIYQTYENTPLERLPSNLPGLAELQEHKENNKGGMKLINEALALVANKVTLK